MHIVPKSLVIDLTCIFSLEIDLDYEEMCIKYTVILRHKLVGGFTGKRKNRHVSRVADPTRNSDSCWPRYTSNCHLSTVKPTRIPMRSPVCDFRTSLSC